jgi:FtsH-binding integral membrane protein
MIVYRQIGKDAGGREVPVTTLAVAHPATSPARRTATMPLVFRERSVLAAFGLVLTTLGCVLAVLAASLIGPFIMFVAPLILVFGFAFGPLKGEL